MENMEEFLTKLNVPTNELKSETIQEVLSKTKKDFVDSDQNKALWNEVTQRLWLHLHKGFNKFDDQLLCSTCFYTALTHTNSQEFYLNEISLIIENELVLKGKDNDKTSQAISLMYGIFQSAYVLQKDINDLANLSDVLESMFKLLVIKAYQYSKFTFIIFKIISSFKKVCGTDLQRLIFKRDNQVKLLNIVNHNWENPITGVRDMNKVIFHTIISVTDEVTYNTLLEEINGFYWNKAKYLMLSEIIDHYNKDFITLVRSNNWIDGLSYSLHKPGLVSAGADMYFAVLNKLRSEEEWCNIFMSHITKILNGSSNKAIENFSNYWCLTTFKRFPSLIQILINEFEIFETTEQKLYSSLSILRKGNKLGQFNGNWESKDTFKKIEEMVHDSLEHYDSNVRMLAFDIVCLSQGKAMPTMLKYEMVLSYIHNNVNSDCTVLRLTMFNSLSNFLIQLHTSFLNNLKKDMSCDIDHLQNFCKIFQEFIVNSLNINGNYQRKITCVKLTDLFLNSLNEVPRKRQKQTNQSNITIINILKEKRLWVFSEENFIMKLLSLLSDPADDVRDNVVTLLMNHYSAELRQTKLLNLLIERALESMKSKFFYQISCGRSMFKLVTKVLIKENHSESTFKTVEDIFNHACDAMISEYKIKRNVVESIEIGKQLNSFMIILQTVLEMCYQNSYRITISNENMSLLLDALDDISNQFAWEEENITSSDFSKMSDMVENIIVKSGYNPNDENDLTKISGLHQIVLNCLWLNVKASCDLSSILIQCQREDSQIDVCERCLNIIINVLETCRHKGAIEAAGTALGQCIHHLTSLPEDSKISKIPYSLLKSKLGELISEASKMASITRRGAGLSIMVHKIVSSDTKRGKPLFHYFMNTLLQTCDKTEDIPNKSDNLENEKDLPKAIYIHFLTRIVTDSSLASDMMFYSAKLAELAFDNLTSSHWQIRNAALQLYGALIPKLIGQKKASGTDKETIATVGCDELRTHSPMLWKYILNQLKNDNYSDKLQYHSNLVPILNMLANIAKRYNFTYDMLGQKQADADLLKSLIFLLDSPIYCVRRLTAKCISNIFTFVMVYDLLDNLDCVSENFLHGSLMLVSNYYKPHFRPHDDNFNNLKIKFHKTLNFGQHSYLCKRVFENIFDEKKEINIDYIKLTLVEVDENAHAPGIYHWAISRLHKYIEHSSWKQIAQFLEIVLERNNFERCCESLLVRMEKDESIPKDILFQITEILLSFNNKFNCGIIWRILYQIALKIDLSGQMSVSEIVQYIKEKGISYNLRYIIPLMARICPTISNEQELLILAKTMNSLTDPESSDVDMRYIAAMGNNELGNAYKVLPEVIKIIAIASEIILLQDEDEDVRNLAVHFYKNITNVMVAPQPYICLQKLLEYNLLCTVLSRSGIEQLCSDLEGLIFCNTSETIDDNNPFANDSKNIYMEGNVFEQLIKNLKIAFDFE